MNWVMLCWMTSKWSMHPPVLCSWIDVPHSRASQSPAFLTQWHCDSCAFSVLFLFPSLSLNLKNRQPQYFISISPYSLSWRKSCHLYSVSPVLGMTCFAAIHSQDIGTDPLVFSAGSCPALIKKGRWSVCQYFTLFRLPTPPEVQGGVKRIHAVIHTVYFSLRITDSGEN